MPKILIVDDVKSIVKGLIHNFEKEGVEAEGVYDGITAWEHIKTGKYNLVILDLMLPGIDGFSLCRKIRKEFDIPIIMLTARDDDIDKITGLELGADDYVSKPFNVRELIARVNSVLRRTYNTESKLIVYSDIRADLDKRTVKIGDREIDLTSKEFDLLMVFLKSPGRVFTREQLLDLVWKLEYADERTVDVNIRRLREKIEKDSKHPNYILTKWGVGYYLK
ncbi:MAG: response regulator transcription factor [Syntrophomonadaceae bacterium]|nr:response regulator transcription factor [Syntrophomonadaceae bacterium]